MTGPAGRFWLLESALRLLTANLRSDVVFVVNFKWQFNVGITIAEPGNILKKKQQSITYKQFISIQFIVTKKTAAGWCTVEQRD